ncbi:MAG: hypothetical protein K0S08_2161 [Gammaproteobacteria bacterium]|jgi:hypothetical protein|nr:hypothetical protein [Gammaproteobacteria bacterium]
MAKNVFKLSILILTLGLSGYGYAQQEGYPQPTTPPTVNTPTAQDWAQLRLDTLQDKAQELEVYPLLAERATAVSQRIEDERKFESQLRKDWLKEITALGISTKNNPTFQRTWLRISDLKAALENRNVSNKALSDRRKILLAQMQAEILREYEIRYALNKEIKRIQSEVTATGAILKERAEPTLRKTDAH